MKRKDTYYFVIKLNNNYVFKKSLRTSNFIYANILKLKILEIIKQVKNENWKKQVLNNTDSVYNIQEFGNGLTIIAENEDEEKYLKEVKKSIIKKIKVGAQTLNIDVDNNETRDRQTLKKSCENFLTFKEKTVSNKVMMKYRQAVEYLYIYFGENLNIKKIEVLDAYDYRDFLLDVPVRWKHRKDLKDKDLKILVKNNSKLLKQYPRQELRTIDEGIVKCKSIFAYFKSKTLIYSNPFEEFKKLSLTKDIKTSWEEYKVKELRSIFSHMIENNQIEEYRFMKFGLMTGLRRKEILGIKIEDINFERCYITVYGTKTENSKRLMPIHKDLLEDLEIQNENKSSEDFLFFDKLLNKYKRVIVGEAREEAVGTNINSIIKEVVGETRKAHLNIHSLRKNFMITIFLSDVFNHLEQDTLNGHANSSVLDIHYLRGLRDYKVLKEKIDKVDFTHFFKNIFKIEEPTYSF